MQKRFKHFILLLILPCITACGFHLRGIHERPAWLQYMDVQNTASPEFMRSLKIALQQTAPNEIRYHLFIDNETFNQQLVSVGAGTNPRQYLLDYTVQFHLTNVKGQTLLPESNVHVIRQVTINNERILGSNNEERTIQEEMKNDAVSQILLRLGNVNS